MKLLFLTNSLEHGGAERHAIALVNGLSVRGHNCEIAYVKNKSDQLERLRTSENAAAHSLGATRFLDSRAIGTLTDIIRRMRPAAIIAANEYALLHASLARWHAAVPCQLVVTCHATKFLGIKEKLKMLAYRPLFWNAHYAVFVCNAQKRHWHRRGVRARRNIVIHNGIDTTVFSPDVRNDEATDVRRQYGFDSADYVIGITAGLRPEKNHVQLVDAVASLRKRNIPARAMLIGDGETRIQIESRARSAGIADHVVITGFKPDVRPFVTACDVIVLCSITEAMSLAALEAMALCKPVVHSDVGGAREIIEHGVNGYLFPVGGTRALANRLAELADAQLRDRMGLNARHIVSTKFSESAMVDHYERVLLEINGNVATAGVHAS